MKKVFFLLLAVAFASSLGFAEEAAVPAAPAVTEKAAVPAAPVIRPKTFIGKVVSISAGNTLSGMKAQIVAADDTGKQSTFRVADDAIILDKNGEVTSLSWIGRDARVELKYSVTPDGPKMVQLLKVLKGW